MKPMSFLLALGVAGVAALPAFACPGPQNMDRGVIFETQDGTVETHRRFARDMVVIETRFSDGEGSILETRHGIYLASSTPIEDGVVKVGQKDVFASHAELSQWEAPRPDAAWRNEASSGGTATAGALRTITVGGCSYPGFDVALTFKDDPTYTEQYHYLPEMGVGLLVASSTDGAQETYSYTAVRAAE